MSCASWWPRPTSPPAPQRHVPAPDPENPFADPNFLRRSALRRALLPATSASPSARPRRSRGSTSTSTTGRRPRRCRQRRHGPDARRPTSPAYPSEDAVLSGVSAELTQTLFPTSTEEITRRGGRAAGGRAALEQGARPATLAAGLALGKAIARRVRGAGDHWTEFRTAGGTPATRPEALSMPPPPGQWIPWHSMGDATPAAHAPRFQARIRGAWMMTTHGHRETRPGARLPLRPRRCSRGAGRGQERRREHLPRAARHRPTSRADGVSTPRPRPLERHRVGIRRGRPLQRGPRRPRLRAS